MLVLQLYNLMYGELPSYFHVRWLPWHVPWDQSVQRLELKRGDAVVIPKAVSEKGAPPTSKMDFQWVTT